MRLPDPSRSHAVLVGASRFDHEDLPDLPAVRNNLTALAEILTDPGGTGLPPDHCSVLADCADKAAVGSALVDVASRAEDVLIVYYAGHGLVDPRRGELYLTMPDTQPNLLRFTALPFADVRETLLDARAEVRVLLLDCCFSGRAIQAMSDTGSVVSGQIDIAGTYTLTASPANTPANAPEGELFTAFSGELITWLRDGAPDAPELLGLGDTYLHLLRTLTSQGLSQPQQHGTRTASWLALAPNPAFGGSAARGHDEEATPWEDDEADLRDSAQAGDVPSMVRLAWLLMEQVRLDEAEHWFRAAVAADSVDAMTGLAGLLEKQVRPGEAMAWYRKAADAGSTFAMRYIGYLAEQRRKLDEAETWYRRAAEAGDVEGMQELAELCEQRAKVWEGKSREKKALNYWRDAEAWLRKAVEVGDDSAMFRLGWFLMARGRLREAEPYFRQGAESGDTYAMCSLAELLARLNKLDEAEAWYRRSAEAGNEQAMYQLGELLEQQSKIRTAESWYRKAAERDHADGIHALNRIIDENPWLR